ncbi:MAG: phosphatase PAP2 family protein [Proteobacteria bacterium]|nr:MAG: phosphatase PAP2 family protein [Pseudomonadota bacterium]
MRGPLKFFFGSFVVLFILSQCIDAHASESDERLSILDIAFKLPKVYGDTFDIGTDKENLAKWAITGALTAGLIPYDEEIYLETQRLGRRWNISTVDNLKPLIKVGKITVLRGPTDFSSGLYFLGDGWVQLTTASAFLLTGYALDATRPINTGIELFTGLTASTIASQVLKRISGREGPAARTERGGAWRPFPSYNAYQKSRTTYDAFPSGHVMVSTLTFTIIRGNYPEFESILFPAQVVYLTALGFGMLNNGIHWAGDYPLGIMLGYLFGRASLRMVDVKEKLSADKPTALLDPDIFPAIGAEGSLTTNFKWEF